MKKAFRAATWMVVNGLMAWSLWLGAHDGVQGAANVVVFFTWLMAVAYTLAGTDSFIKDMKELPDDRSVPEWLDLAFDLGMLAGMVWFGWWWTAGAYLWSAAAMGSYRGKAEEERERRSLETLG